MGNELFDKDQLIEKFGWPEYFIFGLMLAVSAGIGIFFWWRGQKNNAGKKFNAVVTCRLTLSVIQIRSSGVHKT